MTKEAPAARRWGPAAKWLVPLLAAGTSLVVGQLVMRPHTSATRAADAEAPAVQGSALPDRIEVTETATRNVRRAPELLPCAGTFVFSSPATGGAELASVLDADRDGVVLATKSGRCRLRFESATLSTASVQNTAAKTKEEDTAVSPADPFSGGISTSDLADIITSDGEQRFAVQVDKLLPIFERGGTAVSDLKLRPAGEGVLLESPPGLYGFLGIAQGDVIVSANEEPVHESADLMAPFMELQRGRTMVVKIRREGTPRELRYSAR